MEDRNSHKNIYLQGQARFYYTVDAHSDVKYFVRYEMQIYLLKFLRWKGTEEKSGGNVYPS